MAGYLIQVNWTGSTGAQQALCGVDTGMFPSAVGALNAAKGLVQAFATSKDPSATGFTVSVAATR